MYAISGREVAFAVRGDIVSNTGYAHAARALAAVLSETSPVFGVSIHVDPSDCGEPFPGPLVGPAELGEIAARHALVVIHHTTPDAFDPVLDAVNVGAFYWETVSIPHRDLWVERIAAMDAIWAPTTFVAAFVRSTGYGGPLSVVPWPHDFEPVRTGAPGLAALDGVAALRCDRMCEPGGTLGAPQPLAAAVGGRGLTFLAVQSLSPRKGLPILIADWCRFVAEGAADCTLVLKLSFRHVHGLGADHLLHFQSTLSQLGVKPGQRLNIALVEADLPRAGLQALIASADCLVSASYGEGFGGPLVEAIVENTAVICPTHTGIADLFPPDYRLGVACEPVAVQLRGLPDVYPASCVWNVPESGSLLRALQRFRDMGPAEVEAVKRSAREAAQNFCSLAAAREAVASAVSEIVSAR